MRAAILFLLVASVAAAAPKHKPGAVVLVVDRSGSMQGPKLEAAKEAILATVTQLAPDDQIAIVVFDSEASVLVPLTKPNKAIAKDVAKLQAGGGTNLLPALQSAFDILKPLKLAHRHVILMTDGESPSDGIADLVKTMHDAGITASTIGVQGADRNLLAIIADGGNGRLYMIDDVGALPKIFMKEVASALR